MDPLRRMLSTPQRRKEKAQGLRPYSDPILRHKGNRLELAMALHDSLILGTTEVCEEEIDFFSVIKKWLPVEHPTGAANYTRGGASSSTSPPAVVQMDSDGSLWEMVQRLIADDRLGNCAWEPAPKVQLSSIEAICNLDLSGRAIGLGFAATFQADMPDYYYTLMTEEWQHPFFVLRGITVAELNKYLIAHGRRPLPNPKNQQFVCVIVLLMGWQWSVWVAECVLKDLLHFLFVLYKIRRSTAQRSKRIRDAGDPGTSPSTLREHLPPVFTFEARGNDTFIEAGRDTSISIAHRRRGGLGMGPDAETSTLSGSTVRGGDQGNIRRARAGLPQGRGRYHHGHRGAPTDRGKAGHVVAPLRGHPGDVG